MYRKLFSNGGQAQHFFADLLVAPGVSLQPLPPDSDHVQVGDFTDFQFEGQLGEASRVSELAS